jgi:hypothetical protein
MNYRFRSFPAPSFKQDRISEHYRLNSFLQSALTSLCLQELSAKIYEDDVGSDPLCQKLIQLCPNHSQILRALLLDNICGDFCDESLVVRSWNYRLLM